MLRAVRHWRRGWTHEQRDAAIVVGFIILFALTVASMLHFGVGRVG
jgi:hypothetical protein